MRGTGWLLVSRLAAQGLLLIATVLLAGRLGPAGFGGVAAVVAAVYLANVVTTFGTDMVLIRETAALRPSRWAAALALQLGLGTIAMGSLVAASWLVASPPDVASGLVVYGFALVPMAFFSVATAVLRGRNQMSRYGALGVGAAAGQLAAIAWLVSPGSSVTQVVAVLLGVQVLLAALAWTSAGLGIRGLRTSPAEVRAMARSSALVGVLGSLAVAFNRLPIVVLAGTTGVLATGWFAGAQRLVDASKVAHLALFTAIYPALASTPNPSSLRWAWRVSVAGAVGIAAVTVVVAEPLVQVLYGPGFEPAVGALAILALAVVPSMMSGYRSLELLAAGRERSILVALLVALVTLVSLSVALVSLMGWIGIAWALLAAEVVQAIGLEAAVRRRRLTRPARVAAGAA